MNPSLLLLLALAASHVPGPAVAQRGHIGLGAGASHIDPGSGSGLGAATRASIAACAAFGSRRIRAVLDWQLAIEGSLLGSPGEDSSEGRTVIGIQVVPL